MKLKELVLAAGLTLGNNGCSINHDINTNNIYNFNTIENGKEECKEKVYDLINFSSFDKNTDAECSENINFGKEIEIKKPKSTDRRDYIMNFENENIIEDEIGRVPSKLIYVNDKTEEGYYSDVAGMCQLLDNNKCGYENINNNKVEVFLNGDGAYQELQMIMSDNYMIQKYPIFINEISSMRLELYGKYKNKEYDLYTLETYADVKTMEYIVNRINNTIGEEQIDNIKYFYFFIHKIISLTLFDRYKDSFDLYSKFKKELYITNKRDNIEDEYFYKMYNRNYSNYLIQDNLSEIINRINKFSKIVKKEFKKNHKDIDFQDPILTSPKILLNSI